MSHASRIADALDRADDLAEIDAARLVVEQAEADRATAKRRYLYAPEGQRRSRLKTLLNATEAALKAEARLARLMRQAGLK